MAHCRCSPELRDLVISLTRAAARSERMGRVLAVSCRHASRWSDRPRRRALEIHAPLCDCYENFDIVRFFIWRAAFFGDRPLLIGRERGSSALRWRADRRIFGIQDDLLLRTAACIRRPDRREKNAFVNADVFSFSQSRLIGPYPGIAEPCPSITHVVSSRQRRIPSSFLGLRTSADVHCSNVEPRAALSHDCSCGR
jgi:hypothetical protein